MTANELKTELLQHIPDIDKFCQENSIKRSTFDNKIDRLDTEDIFREVVFKKVGLLCVEKKSYEVIKM